MKPAPIADMERNIRIRFKDRAYNRLQQAIDKIEEAQSCIEQRRLEDAYKSIEDVVALVQMSQSDIGGCLE